MTEQQPRHRIAIIQEKDYLEDTYKTRTVIGLLPYEKEECDRLMRFMPEQYSRPAPSPDIQEIHDQIGKLKTDLFKCIGTIESIQSKLRTGAQK